MTKTSSEERVPVDLWVHRERFPRGHATIPWPTETGRGWLAEHDCKWVSDLLPDRETAVRVGMAHRFDCDPSLPETPPEGRLFA